MTEFAAAADGMPLLSLNDTPKLHRMRSPSAIRFHRKASERRTLHATAMRREAARETRRSRRIRTGTVVQAMPLLRHA